ncbi:MAG: hypothetical protein IKH57_03355 [Clostridia bacterium]|nr:hypothetical protein [Clostridia bacterium]
MKRIWNRLACAAIILVMLCSILPAMAETDKTQEAFAKFAKLLKANKLPLKYDLPDVFEGKAVIAAYYGLDSEPLELSTTVLAKEGDYWMIPRVLLADSIEDADWAFLVYGIKDDEYLDYPLEVYCFAVDVQKGAYYEPFYIYSNDIVLTNGERTYELGGVFAGLEEFVISQEWRRQGGGSDEPDEAAYSSGDEYASKSGDENGSESFTDDSYQEALGYLAEEKYYSAYQAFMASDADDAYEQAQKCIKSWPKNGEVWRSSTAKGDPFEFTIQVNQSNDEAIFLRFLRKGYPISYVFIGGGNSVKITLPKGTYSIKQGTGYEWFGIKEAFGRDGSYKTLTINDSEEIKLEGGYGYTLTINTSEKNPTADDVGSEYESWEDFSDGK